MLIESITAMLANKGLSLISGAVEGAGDKALDWIEEKTGIRLGGEDGQAELTPDQVMTLKRLESEERIELERLALEREKESNRHEETIQAKEVEDRNSARGMYTKGGGKMQDRLISWVLISTSILMPLLLIANGLAIVASKIWGVDPTLCAAVSSILAAAIARLGDERKTILEFAFGGSLRGDRSDKSDHQ